MGRKEKMSLSFLALYYRALGPALKWGQEWLHHPGLLEHHCIKWNAFNWLSFLPSPQPHIITILLVNSQTLLLTII